MRYKYNPTAKNKSAGGMSGDDFYHVFHRIRARCQYKGNKSYPRYGGRGIKFLWKDYPSFKEDMYSSYQKHKINNPDKGTTLERIDNDGHYSKENCRWATWREQSRNKRTSRYLTYKGETKILADWAYLLGCSRQTIRYRLEAGWTPEQIIETPIDYANRPQT